MKQRRSHRYFNSIVWFSVLWGVKEFIIEPIYNKIKTEQNAKKQIRKGELS